MEDSPFYLASITLGHLNWPTSCTEPDDCRRGRRRHRQSEHFLLNANERVSDTIAPIITENTSLISSLTHPFTSTSPSFSTHFPSLPAAQSNSQAEQQYQQQNPLHSCPPQLRKHSLKHTFSTSSKSPYLRLRPPSISDLNQTSTTSTRTSISTLIATSTPTSSMQPTRSRITIKNKLPRFTMHSLLLFSSLCLLILLCNTVPTASASSLTRMVSRSVGSSSSNNNNNNNPGFSGLSSFPSSSSSSFSRRSEPVLHDSDPSGLFGGLVGEDDNSTLMKCAYYNRTQCTHHGTGCGDSYQVCHRHDGPDQNSLCYALWKNTTQTGVVVEFKGCWLGQSKDCIPKGLPENHEADQCVQTSTPNANNKKAVGNGTVKSHLYFCCCNGSKCNKKLKHVPVLEADLVTPVLPPPEPKGPGEDGRKSSFNYPFYVLFSFGIIFFAVVIGVFVFLFGKRRNKPNSGDILQTHQPLLDGSNFNGNFGLSSITLKEIRAQGKFGSVWMASDGGDNMVAVKVFAMQDRNSWQTEKDVFSLPQMKHNNILTFLGAERRGEGIETQYWLVTEYHPNGSLWDYLKSHTVNLNQLLTIVQGIGAGLTHLHEELSPTSTERGKPSIAHRDFKSKNVLLGSKFRPCIADFGLAIVFNPNAILGDAHGQVGTRRYMAPEVLEGAINFNRESFLRIDMYACGLVLWELLSRTSFGEITCGEYRLPFEEEVGPHPSLEDMQVVVSQEKKRPILLDTWFKHPTMAVVANTVQDCWDQDTEARISASTICERINALILAKETEESCLSLNNQNGTAAYRASVPFTGNGGVATSGTLPANGIVSSGMGSVGGAVLGSAKNAFLMTAHPTAAVNGMNSTVTANGSVYAVRETST